MAERSTPAAASASASAYARLRTLPPLLLLGNVLLSCPCIGATPTGAGDSAANMNEGEYGISNGNPTSSGITYSTLYSSRGPTTEYFDVYTPPIRSTYGEVVWRKLDDVPLPDDIVERFADKTMAVVGYEVDQVMMGPTGEDVPVPITWAYNHHYAAWLTNNRKVRLVKRKSSPSGLDHPRMDHGSGEFWTAVGVEAEEGDDNSGTTNSLLEEEEVEEEEASTDTVIPLSTWFSEGNGGEMRLSYHGYPAGYAQLIDSPNTFTSIPMQIDTWNRQTMAKGTTEFKPGGPLPRNSRIPSSAGYSGLIECPCSDRLEKKWWKTYALAGAAAGEGGRSSECSTEHDISDDEECFSAARTLTEAAHYTERIVNDDDDDDDHNDIPAGCTITRRGDGSVDVRWKAHSADAAVSEDGRAGPIARLVGAEEEEGYSKTERVVGFASAQVNVTVDLALVGGPRGADPLATITIVGPADKWFAVGFGTNSMCLKPEADECPGGGPYAIIVNTDGEGNVQERKLDFHGVGKVLSESVTVQSATVTDTNITVVLTRALQGASDDHFTFDPATTLLPIITARGCSESFARHCGHGPSSLTFLPVDEPQEICFKGVVGTIGGNTFHKNCYPFPMSDLLAQKNPTCFIETYRGGLQCCRDGVPLLDKDQEVPWKDQPLEYRLKFRYYFEEYVGTAPMPSHKSLVRLYWQTEASAGEYDIVECPEGTPKSQCVQIITSRWQVKDMMNDCSVRQSSDWCTGTGSTDPTKTEGIELIYAAPHCHAPSCISMDLYNADTGDLLCHVEPTFGRSNKVHDERNFLALPPCLWGDESEGLLSPSLLSLDATLLSIKKNNNTLGHTGEMASWQMRGVVIPREYGNEDITGTFQANDESLSSALRGQVRG